MQFGIIIVTFYGSCPMQPQHETQLFSQNVLLLCAIYPVCSIPIELLLCYEIEKIT